MAESLYQESIQLTGLPGATAPTRFVGGTVSGYPTSGSFIPGDFVIDQTGATWVCTTSGSPGTWSNPMAKVTTSLASAFYSAQTAAIGTTALYTAPASGFYQLSYYAKVTSTGTTSTLGPFTVTTTDIDGTTITNIGDATSANTVVSGFINGIIPILVGSGTTINFAIPYASTGGTPMAYEAYVSVNSANITSTALSGVNTFNGRSGAVSPSPSDYSAYYVSTSGNNATVIGSLTVNSGLTVSGTATAGGFVSNSSINVANNNGGTSSRIYLANGDTNHWIYSTGSTGNNTLFGEYYGWYWYNTQYNQNYMQLIPPGLLGLQLQSQTPTYPSNAILEVNNNGSGAYATAWFKNYYGSYASPTEANDWPWPVLNLTAYGNYNLQTMQVFSLPGDNVATSPTGWFTGNNVWNFRLNGVTLGGFDNAFNSGNTTPINISTGSGGSGPTGLQLLGPGNLRMGCDTTSSTFRIYNNGSDRVYVTSAGYMLIGYSSSNGSYNLQVNSQIFATNASIATSDARYKENVSTISGGVNLIKALNPVEFTWKTQEDVVDEEGKILREKHNFVEGKNLGFIAQEVQEAFKDQEWIDNLVKKNTREAIVNPAGEIILEEEEFLGIAESQIIPILVAAIQELTARVEELEKKNN